MINRERLRPIGEKFPPKAFGWLVISGSCRRSIRCVDNSRVVFARSQAKISLPAACLYRQCERKPSISAITQLSSKRTAQMRAVLPMGHTAELIMS
jgi:hypothetical protein